MSSRSTCWFILALVIVSVAIPAWSHHRSLGRWVFSDCGDLQEVEIVEENGHYATFLTTTAGKRFLPLLQQAGGGDARFIQEVAAGRTRQYRVTPRRWLILEEEGLRCQGKPAIAKGGTTLDRQ